MAEQQVKSRASRDGCEGRVPMSRCQQGCVPGEGCCSSSSLLDHTGWSPTAGATPKTLCKTEALWFYDRERAQGLPTYAGGHPHPGRQRDCVDGARLTLPAPLRPRGYLGLTVLLTAALVILIGLVSCLADAGAVRLLKDPVQAPTRAAGGTWGERSPWHLAGSQTQPGEG